MYVGIPVLHPLATYHATPRHAMDSGWQLPSATSVQQNQQRGGNAVHMWQLPDSKQTNMTAPPHELQLLQCIFKALDKLWERASGACPQQKSHQLPPISLMLGSWTLPTQYNKMLLISSRPTTTNGHRAALHPLVTTDPTLMKSTSPCQADSRTAAQHNMEDSRAQADPCVTAPSLKTEATNPLLENSKGIMERNTAPEKFREDANSLIHPPTGNYQPRHSTTTLNVSSTRIKQCATQLLAKMCIAVQRTITLREQGCFAQVSATVYPPCTLKLGSKYDHV